MPALEYGGAENADEAAGDADEGSEGDAQRSGQREAGDGREVLRWTHGRQGDMPYQYGYYASGSDSEQLMCLCDLSQNLGSAPFLLRWPWILCKQRGLLLTIPVDLE